MEKWQKKMIEEFQCPGCVAGGDIECGECKLKDEHGYVCCGGHVLGTMLGLGNNIALGLPKGFNKPGINDEGTRNKNTMDIRLWKDVKDAKFPMWDHLNIPVWAMEKDGYLFVRTYCPRINRGYVDVIKDGTLAMVPNALDVSKFINTID